MLHQKSFEKAGQYFSGVAEQLVWPQECSWSVLLSCMLVTCSLRVFFRCSCQAPDEVELFGLWQLSAVVPSVPVFSVKYVCSSSELQSPEGIAIDHVARLLFWTDSTRDTIEVSKLDGSHRRVLFDTDLVNPRPIVTNPAYG